MKRLEELHVRSANWTVPKFDRGILFRHPAMGISAWRDDLPGQCLCHRWRGDATPDSRIEQFRSENFASGLELQPKESSVWCDSRVPDRRGMFRRFAVDGSAVTNLELIESVGSDPARKRPCRLALQSCHRYAMSVFVVWMSNVLTQRGWNDCQQLFHPHSRSAS